MSRVPPRISTGYYLSNGNCLRTASHATLLPTVWCDMQPGIDYIHVLQVNTVQYLQGLARRCLFHSMAPRRLQLTGSLLAPSLTARCFHGMDAYYLLLPTAWSPSHSNHKTASDPAAISGRGIAILLLKYEASYPETFAPSPIPPGLPS